MEAGAEGRVAAAYRIHEWRCSPDRTGRRAGKGEDQEASRPGIGRRMSRISGDGGEIGSGRFRSSRPRREETVGHHVAVVGGEEVEGMPTRDFGSRGGRRGR